MNRSSQIQRGSSLLEVVVTLAILAIGLLGLVGLQSRLQVSEMEAYQRAQALILLNDMASRISANREYAADYVTTSPLGYSMTCPTDVSTRAKADLSEWCNALQGASETTGGNKVGVMVDGRGCVEALASDVFMVTVAWRGLAPISAPPASVGCGVDLYDGGSCTNDQCRRVVTTIVRVATL